MYVYYVCLLLLSEFNKCWREWSHTDNEIDENQKKKQLKPPKNTIIAIICCCSRNGWMRKNKLREYQKCITLFFIGENWQSISMCSTEGVTGFFFHSNKNKKNCESTTRNRTYNKCTPTETTEVEMRKFEEKSKRLLYSNWSKSLAPSLWSAWSWKHNSQIVFSQKTMCRENVGAVRHNNMKW